MSDPDATPAPDAQGESIARGTYDILRDRRDAHARTLRLRADALNQKRLEVFGGTARTYDLRGKRFAVCMAGNPYTESGETFQIPDMLANRADTYNLGDILEGRDEVFALSYLENALTSNSTLARLTTRDPQDVYQLIKMAQGAEIPPDQLACEYSTVELEEILSVFRKLIRVQQVLMTVNQQYIYSAAQDDAYRNEPRFQLQGSYRNMNKLAEKIVAVMNDAELEALIDDHYLGEAQTLTTGAEANLLKLAELRGRMTPEQAKRWDEIKRGFARRQVMGGDEEDPAVKVIGQLALLSDRLQDIGRTIESAADGRSGAAELGEALGPYLESLRTSLTKTMKKETDGDAAAVAKLSEGLDRVVERLGGLAEAVTTRLASPSEAPAVAAPAASASPSADLSPYLDKLTAAMASLAEAPRGAEVIQTLDSGVYELLEQMLDKVGDHLLPTVKGIGRRLKGTELEADRGLTDQLDRTLKSLDILKDLLASLRKIDTRRLAARG